MCLGETLDINFSPGRIHGLYIRNRRNVAILHIVFLRSKINGGGKVVTYIVLSYYQTRK